MAHSHLTAAIIFGIGSLQGLIVALNLLFIRRGNRKANLVLTALILAISLLIFQNFIGVSGLYKKMPHVIFLFYPLNGLLGPLFFLYVCHLLRPNRPWRWTDLLHSLGFVVLLAWHWDYLFIAGDRKIGFAEYIYYQQTSVPRQAFYSIVLLRLHTFGYALAAILKLRHSIKYLKSDFSDSNILYISNFQVMAYLFMGYALLSAGVTSYGYLFSMDLGLFEIYGHVVNSVFIVVVVTFTIHFPERLFFTLSAKSAKIITNSPRNGPVKLLLEHMKEHKLYLNPELKLHDFAGSLSMAPHSVSERLNQEMGMSFFDFVNHFRVEEFKSRAHSEKYSHLTLLAIAYDVGFNSKASFNRIFKRSTGMTPSQFLAEKVSTSETETINA